MIVLLVILLFISLFIKRFIAPRERHYLIFLLFLICIWSLFWLTIIQTELFYKRGIGTYGSDADYYYTEMLRAYESETPIQTAAQALSRGYVTFGTFILLTSPLPSVVWIKLGNILLFLLCLLFVYWLMRRRNIKPRFTLLFLAFLGFNGIITWMVLRNLKDTLFITLAFLEIIIIYALFYHKKFVTIKSIVFSFFLTLFFGYLISTIRPWGMFFSFLVLLSIFWGAFFEGYVKKRNLLFILVISLGLSFFFKDWFLQNTRVYGQYSIIHRELSYSFLQNPFWSLVAPFRFLVGPGFIRALHGSEIFEVTTGAGNFLIALGSFMWWILLPVLIMATIQYIPNILKKLSLTGPPFAFLLVYSYAYGGTADTRTRAVFYILCIPLIASYIADVSEYSATGRNNRKIIYFSLLILLISLGTIFSYLTI